MWVASRTAEPSYGKFGTTEQTNWFRDYKPVKDWIVNDKTDKDVLKEIDSRIPVNITRTTGGVPNSTELRYVASGHGPQGPYSIYLYQATMIMNLPMSGWLFFNSSPPPKKYSPYYVEDDAGKPMHITGTFLQESAKSWFDNCIKNGDIEADNSPSLGKILIYPHKPN